MTQASVAEISSARSCRGDREHTVTWILSDIYRKVWTEIGALNLPRCCNLESGEWTVAVVLVLSLLYTMLPSVYYACISRQCFVRCTHPVDIYMVHVTEHRDVMEDDKLRWIASRPNRASLLPAASAGAFALLGRRPLTYFVL